MSRLPGLIGLCQSDVNGVAEAVNTAQERLIYAKESGEEGWFNTFAEIVFNVSRAQPYITLPREVARLEVINVCNKPIPVQNQFYEYLSFGNGRMPKTDRRCAGPEIKEAYSRNNAVVFTEMTSAPQFISVYLTDAQDIGKRILIQGLDADGATIYSQDNENQVTGVFLALASPSVMTAMTLSDLQGIQKDITVGQVRIYQHDPNTGDEVLLLTMEPGEMTASYRRYYFSNLPCGCCAAPGATDDTTVQVTAIAKLEPIPVRVDTDWLLIQNRQAIIAECQSVRYDEMDTQAAKQMARERHEHAIGLLNGELAHYIGKESVAVGFAPFGSARLSRRRIGSLI
jgi:hypothetical protein